MLWQRVMTEVAARAEATLAVQDQLLAGLQLVVMAVWTLLTLHRHNCSQHGVNVGAGVGVGLGVGVGVGVGGGAAGGGASGGHPLCFAFM